MIMIAAKTRRGFTLVELAIVLGIIGLLLAGLFQLTSASSRQINNQITAQQLQAWSKAAKSYLITKRANATGSDFYDCTPTCGSSTYSISLNQVVEITSDVYGFKANGLPATSPLGAPYKAVIKRIADVGGQGSYVIVIGFGAGAANYDNLQLGNIAIFTGAEGARISVPNDPSDPSSTTTCTGTMAAIGAFGGVCYDVSAFGLTANRPGTLAFFNMIDSGNSDSNYLWRVPAIPGDYNKMTVDLSLGLGGRASVTGDPDILFNGLGSIAMDGGSITGVRGGIQTNSGTVATGGGIITTGGGDIDIGDSSGTDGGGALLLGKSRGMSMSMQVNPTGYLGTTPSVSMPLYMEGGGANFSGTVEALGFTAQQFIYTTSDRTLKKDIQDLHNVLPSLARLNGKRYTLKSSDHTDLGLIAQDVQQVFPELVAEHDGHLVMNYQGMVGPLITGINELAAENATLNDRVTRLELLLAKQLQGKK